MVFPAIARKSGVHDVVILIDVLVVAKLQLPLNARVPALVQSSELTPLGMLISWLEYGGATH